MCKLLVFPIVFAVFFVDICAFGATARGLRGAVDAGQNNATSMKNTNSSTSSEGRAVAARAGVRANAKLSSNMVRTNVKAGMANTVSAGDPVMGVATRAAARPNVKMTSNMVRTNVKAGMASTVSAGEPIMGARSATKQKAINMGTKVATAVDNTMIPQECQNAFYGCMDSFCMVDNTTGGRCRCDDRGEELDNVLDQIMKLDSQSQTLAEEGVERLQHGDAVDTIYSMAEQAADQVIADQNKNQKNFFTNKTKQSNLPGLFDTDELLGGLGDDILDSSDLVDKKGNSLRSVAIKMCTPGLSSQCKEHSPTLQFVYAQKIKSDCAAYENDLKQRKMNSESLLKNAQKAIRDAAAEQYANKNKYKTVGECVVAFKQCMIGEEVCGSGFSKCVVDPTLLNDSSSKPYTIKTAKSITVEISASTYGSLEGNRGFCDSVLAQCVEANKNDAVWKQFLVTVAPELKAAEYNAEDESRRNCAQNVLSCIKQQATAEGFQEGTDNWYIFTSNPENVENFCGGELRKCSAYDKTGEKGTMYDAVMNFVRLSLNALRADRCTITIKKCLQDSCGTDYSECLGFTVQDLQIYCPLDVIEVDCAGKEGDIYNYVNEVAQGVFLNADNALQKACLNAVNTAMTTYCNGTTSCSDAGLDYSGLISKYLNYRLYGGCQTDNNGVEKCNTKDSIHELSAADNLSCPKWVAKLDYGEIARYIKNDVYNNITSDDPFIPAYNSGATTGDSEQMYTAVSDVLDKLNNDYKSVIKSIETDPYVSKCMNGTSYSDFVGEVHSTTKDGEETKFSNLTNNTRLIVARGIYDKFISQFNARVEELNEEIDAANDQINTIYAEADMECADTMVNSTCKIGQCNSCTKPEAKCKCIAATYFQAVHAIKNGNVGEVVMLGGALYDQSNQCTITYRRHHACSWKGEGDGDARTGWDCVSHDDVRRVTFNLTRKDKISVTDDENCVPKGDDWVAKALKIGDYTTICFHTCAKTPYYKIKAKVDQNNFGNYFGDKLWCTLDEEEEKNGHVGVSITDTDSDEDPISHKVLKHAEYKFYGSVESVP